MMLSIFACPKPFTNPHTAIIQRNAITSWTLLHPKPEVILFGDDEGIASICEDLGLRHVPEVARNEFGTPLLNDLFAKANQIAVHDLLCYVNADIILTSDFMLAAQEVYRWRKRALMVGDRRNVPIRGPLDFAGPDWESRLRAWCDQEDFRLHEWHGEDYFLYPKGLYDRDFPSFGLGRGRWGGWLIFRARQLGCPVVDVSRVAIMIHQDHDYTHLSYAAADVRNLTRHEFWRRNEQLVEFQRNKTLHDSATPVKFSLIDATHILTRRGIKLANERKYRSRSFVTLRVLHPRWAALIGVAEYFTRASLPVRQALRRATSKFASMLLDAH